MEKGLNIKGIKNFTPKETYSLCSEGAVLVDVREEYLNSHKCYNVPQILFYPFSTLEQKFNEFDKHNLLIFADSTGLKSIKAVQYLKEKGYDNVANMTGGLVEWERNGLPVVANVKEKLSGSCMCQIKYRNIDK